MEKVIETLPIYLILIPLLFLALKAFAKPSAQKTAILAATFSYEIPIRQYATQYNFDPDLIKAIIYTESRGNPIAYNAKEKAVGLMQLRDLAIVDAARYLRVPIPSRKELFDPQKNIQFGTAYLASQRQRWNCKDVWQTISCYNAGRLEYTVSGDFINQNYVDKVEKYYQALK